MGLRINTNIASINAQRQLGMTTDNLSKSLEKLSSGLRINHAADDAAGLAISEKLRAQVRGYGVAERNAQDGISLIQTAEGALESIGDILQRMNEIAEQAANGTYNTTDLAALSSEVGQLASEIDRIASNAKFNGITLLAGSSSVTIQVGLSNTTNDTLVLSLATVSVSALTLSSAAASIAAGGSTAQGVLNDVAAAITQVNKLRGQFGATVNRLDFTRQNIQVTAENLQASESRVRDVDVAAEMAKFTKYQILQQAGTSMLAQANSAPQAALSLLKG